jgi:predicted aspartyl protease
MADEEEIIWSYDNHPYLGVRLKTYAGREYPSTNNEDQVMIDTGYSGEILLPIKIYIGLGFNDWEEPIVDDFELVDKTEIKLKVANGLILIPKLNNQPFPVRVHSASDEKQDTEEIIIGVKFIKKFKLLLDGPADKVSILF